MDALQYQVKQALCAQVSWTSLRNISYLTVENSSSSSNSSEAYCGKKTAGCWRQSSGLLNYPWGVDKLCFGETLKLDDASNSVRVKTILIFFWSASVPFIWSFEMFIRLFWFTMSNNKVVGRQLESVWSLSLSWGETSSKRCRWTWSQFGSS